MKEANRQLIVFPINAWFQQLPRPTLTGTTLRAQPQPFPHRLSNPNYTNTSFYCLMCGHKTQRVHKKIMRPAVKSVSEVGHKFEETSGKLCR